MPNLLTLLIILLVLCCTWQKTASLEENAPVLKNWRHFCTTMLNNNTLINTKRSLFWKAKVLLLSAVLPNWCRFFPTILYPILASERTIQAFVAALLFMDYGTPSMPKYDLSFHPPLMNAAGSQSLRRTLYNA